jgi:hypothetical protein
MELTYKRLKERHRSIRDDFSTSLSLRTHRALSWLQRAEIEHNDHDARFLFMWIAFNAAYANEIHDRQQYSERKVFLNFLTRLIESDQADLLYRIVWSEFPSSIRLLIDNKYVYQPFWDHQNGKLSATQWRDDFQRSKTAAYRALGRIDTRRILTIVFDRLYVLRNQLVHGGATWNSRINRGQVRDGVRIMDRLVPTVIHLMMENPGYVWGDPCYPVVDG